MGKSLEKGYLYYGPKPGRPRWMMHACLDLQYQTEPSEECWSDSSAQVEGDGPVPSQWLATGMPRAIGANVVIHRCAD